LWSNRDGRCLAYGGGNEEAGSHCSNPLSSKVMKKLVAIAPTHCHLFIAELADAVQILTKSAMVELHGEAVKALLCVVPHHVMGGHHINQEERQPAASLI